MVNLLKYYYINISKFQLRSLNIQLKLIYHLKKKPLLSYTILTHRAKSISEFPEENSNHKTVIKPFRLIPPNHTSQIRNPKPLNKKASRDKLPPRKIPAAFFLKIKAPQTF